MLHPKKEMPKKFSEKNPQNRGTREPAASPENPQILQPGDPIPVATPRELTAPEPERTPCAYFRCAANHTWPLTIQVAGCPGCQGPSYAIEAQLCPICNEPFAEAVVRIDITSSLIGIPATCRGQAGRALTAFVTIPYTAWKDWQILEYATPRETPLEGGKLYDSLSQEPLPTANSEEPEEPQP